MKVLIVEDEAPTARRLIKMLEKYDDSVEVLGCFSSVGQTLAYFSNTNVLIPDLLFLDIHLDDDLGFAVLENLDLNLPVIFTTAYSEYSLKAFKSFSIDYLVKPIDYDELCVALDKFKSIVMLQRSAPEPVVVRPDRLAEGGYKDRFMVSIGPNIVSIAAAQVAYFLYEQKATFLVTTTNKRYALDYSLSALSQVLDPRLFFRVNRSVIVSMDSIRSVFSYSSGKLRVDLAPDPKDEIFVSLDRISPFKYWLGK